MLTNNDLIMSNFPAQTSSVSIVQWTPKILGASWQISVSSGTLNGTFTLQVSNDIAQGAPPNQFQPTNWTSIGTVSVACSSTAAGATSFLIPSQTYPLSYEYMRLSYSVGNSGAALGVYSVRQKSVGA